MVNWFLARLSLFQRTLQIIAIDLTKEQIPPVVDPKAKKKIYFTGNLRESAKIFLIFEEVTIRNYFGFFLKKP